MKKMIIPGLLAVLLVTACSGKEKIDDGGGEDTGKILPVVPFSELPATQASFAVAGNLTYVNVMENNQKPLPSFVTVKPKANKVLGYVKDTYGRPVKNASIVIGSSYGGGWSTPATGKTNDKGYYEIEVPVGVARFASVGHTIDYEGSRIALGLYPADGVIDTWASAEGMVKNFVLMPYGKGDPDNVASYPWDPNNYFGGCLALSWTVGNYLPTDIPEGSVIEIKLIPLDLWHAAEKKTFTIRKTIENLSCRIINIPIGKYRVEIRNANGTAMRIRETGVNPTSYGLSPKTSEDGIATFTMRASSADAGLVAPFRGYWEDISVMVEKK